MVTERPILMNGPMVRAVLAGTKTQTRRIVKPQPVMRDGGWYWTHPRYDNGMGVKYFHTGTITPSLLEAMARCYGQPGDRLWVRETWAAHWMYNDVPAREAKSGLPDDNYWYAADGDDAQGSHGCPAQGRRGKWRPSIHMPRWASRLTLEITDVRVERLNDISEEDARAEGVDWKTCPTVQTQESFEAQAAARRIGMAAHYVAEIQYRGGFERLWESINGSGSWAANPLVWVIVFRRST